MKRIIKVLICCILAVSMLTPMTALAASRLATPKKLQVAMTTTSSVSLNWNKVKGAAKYTVQYSTNKKFKKAKKVTVSANKATVKKLAAKKVYYFRVRATKKGRKASAYTKTVKAKTVFNVDKKLKGSWVNSEYYIGNGILELKFNGKGKVSIKELYDSDTQIQTVSYKKGKRNRVSFSTKESQFIVRCYQDSDQLYVVEKSKGDTQYTIYTKHIPDKNISFEKYKKNFKSTHWSSEFFTNECKKLLKTSDNIEAYLKTNGHTNSSCIATNIKNNVLCTWFDLGNYSYSVIAEKTSGKTINAFIIKRRISDSEFISYEKEVWTKV